MYDLEVVAPGVGQRPPDRQVQRLGPRGRQRGARGLLHALVQELITTVDRDHQPARLGLADRSGHLGERRRQQRGQQARVEARADAGRRGDDRQRRRRQLVQATGDQLAEVVGQPHLRGLLRSPLPLAELAVEAQRALLVQRLGEQAHEERVAGAAGMDEVDEAGEVL